jgi:UTP--glucose-1-phosphate uridylyltransferase
MKKPVTKAIIAAAGLGTRFLPQTKAMPKEMLPIIDKPVIQLIVEDAVASGITDIIIVTGSTKRAIEDHFDRSIELEEALIKKGKDNLAKEIRSVAEMANFIYLRQKGEPKGNARPLLNAAHLLGDEPFLMFFADDFFRSDVPHAKQLIEAYEKVGESVISLIEVPKSEADKWGMVAVSDQVDDKTHKITQLVEKPGPEKAPSNFASISGYLLTPEIVPLVEKLKPSSRGEIEMPEAINELAQSGKVYGKFIEGVRHDTGDKQSYLQAVVDTALEDERLGADFRAYLEKRLEQ